MNPNPNRAIFSFFLLAITLLALPSAAQPGGTYDPTPPSSRTFVTMEASRLGQELTAEGSFVLQRKGGVQFLAAKVAADLADGTVVILSVVTDEGEEDVESLSLSLGGADTKLFDWERGDSPAFPIEDVQAVIIRFRGEILLVGRVPR